MAGKDVDENNPDYTNDIIEIYQEELHYVGGEKWIIMMTLIK